MVDSSVLDAMAKVLIVSPPWAPGPMLGCSGRLDPHFDPDDKIQTDPNHKLQKVLDDVVKNTLHVSDNAESRNRFAFAVVDLTDDPMNPAYAGWNDRKQLYVASLAKLLPLYAAFQLRADLRGLASFRGSTDLAALARDARQRYSNIKAANGNLPKIENLFTFNSSGKVDFTSEPKSDTELDLAYPNRTIVSQLKTRELLLLMAGWSNDIAAGLVIQSLGFDYLWMLANRSGLFLPSWPELTSKDHRASGPAGLFIAKDYDHGEWDPADRLRKGAPPERPRQAANARSVATLMTMLGQDRLIDDNAHTLTDHEAHFGMWEMLRKLKDFSARGLGLLNDENSPIGLGMDQSGWEADQVPLDFRLPPPATYPNTPLAVSKIGAEGIDKCNTLLVRTKPIGASKTITAVLVAIDNSNSIWNKIFLFGKTMAQKLVDRHS